MKKFIILSLVFILLAFSVAPVMAAKPNNGHGNGVGQGNGVEDRDQTRQQDRDHARNGQGKTLRGSSAQSMRMRTPFYLQGTIETIKTSPETLSINIIHGNAQVKSYIGSKLTLTVTGTTLIFKITQGQGSASEAPSTRSSDDETPGDRVAIKFSQLAHGDKVAIHGNVVNGVFIARLITVYVNSAVGQTVAEKP